MSRAGDFEVYVSNPYPVSIDIKYNDQTISGVRHDELSDLKYAVDKAMQEARLKLKGREGEI